MKEEDGDLTEVSVQTRPSHCCDQVPDRQQHGPSMVGRHGNSQNQSHLATLQQSMETESVKEAGPGYSLKLTTPTATHFPQDFTS